MIEKKNRPESMSEFVKLTTDQVDRALDEVDRLRLRLHFRDLNKELEDYFSTALDSDREFARSIVKEVDLIVIRLRKRESNSRIRISSRDEKDLTG